VSDTTTRGVCVEVQTAYVPEQPVLAPGESFEYTSFCPLPTPIGSMHGSYQMVTASGTPFDAEIAPFPLAVPTAVN
jgi:ApaG protein